MDMLTCDCLQAATLLAADSLRRINPSLADLVLRRSQDINIPVVGDETNAYFPSVNLQIVADKQANAVRRASVYLLYLVGNGPLLASTIDEERSFFVID